MKTTHQRGPGGGRQPSIRALFLLSAMVAAGCSERVIGSGEYICKDDRDCAQGWRCLSAGQGKVCVDPASGADGSTATRDSGPVVTGDGDLPLPDRGVVSARCGDGVLDSDEDCDLGELNSMLPDAPCRPDCKPARCGDGIKDSAEACDDGSAWCSADCTASKPLALGIDPPALHFGNHGIGCGTHSVQAPLSIYNPSSATVAAVTLELVGDCGVFSLGDAAKQMTTGPIPAGKAVTVQVQLTVPASPGTFSCTLRASLDGASLAVPLTAQASLKDQQVDRFLQRATRQVDILFAIDPSGSMTDERSRLMATAGAFAAAAAQAQLDFHLGAISIVEPQLTEAAILGQLEGDPRYITGQSADLPAEFKTRIDLPMAGGIERGLDAIAAALSPELTASVAEVCTVCPPPFICVAGGCRRPNWGFRRQGASLEVLTLTDEADGSALGAVDLLAALSKQVNPLLGQSVRVHGLLPTQGANCSMFEPTPVWDELIALSGGLRHDICANDFVPAIEAIADRLFGLRRQFTLTRTPKDPAVLTVTVDGQAVKYSYDATSNTVTLPVAPADGAKLTVEYSPACS